MLVASLALSRDERVFEARARACARVGILDSAGRGSQHACFRRAKQASAGRVTRRSRLVSMKEGHAEHPYVPLLLTVPGIGWVLAFTIAAEIGEIERFPSPEKLAGYAGLCPRVNQSGEKDRRGPLTKHGPTYLRWALLEATMHALRHPAYAERYQRTKRRLGKQRGAKVAQVDIARRLAHAIWHMLSRKEKFAPRGAAFRLAA